MKLVVSFATGIIGEWWANLINAQFGIPVACGCTAVSAPKYYAFLQSGQMVGLLGGLKGASEYEWLLMDAYPKTPRRVRAARPLHRDQRDGRADDRSLDHSRLHHPRKPRLPAYAHAQAGFLGGMMETLGIWIAAFLTLCLMSFLYKDNRFFRFAESVFAGVSLGYYVGQEASQTIRPNLIDPLRHDFAHNWDLIFRY